jgi:hypothetical protein
MHSVPKEFGGPKPVRFGENEIGLAQVAPTHTAEDGSDVMQYTRVVQNVEQRTGLFSRETSSAA